MSDLRKKLKRLGVTKGRNFKPKSGAKNRAKKLEYLPGAQVQETAKGACLVITHHYPLDTRQGDLALGEWLTLAPATLAQIGDDPALAEVDPRSYLFLDTETTGLGGGAIAFQVGVGFFNNTNQFEIRQYFLREPDEEAAMLTLLHDLLHPDSGLVTFNGRSFDVPLLLDRVIRNRIPARFNSFPNLDLLFPARRLWRRRLLSCALGALEEEILGLQRTASDVPGRLIPTLYNQYLRSGDAGQMPRILYHNEQDLLSLVVLGVILCRAFENPSAPELPVEDRLSLAHWYQRRGMLDECEAAYRMAGVEAPDADSRYDALVGLATLLKRTERRIETIPLWTDVADIKLDVLGHEELAKVYEWHAKDLAQALTWTETGIALAETWRPGLRRSQALGALEHRQKRLLRKIGSR